MGCWKRSARAWMAAGALIAGAARASSGWSEEGREGEGAEPGPPPRMLETRDMLDEVEGAIGEWRDENQAFLSAQVDQERVRAELWLADESRGSSSGEGEAEAGPPSRAGGADAQSDGDASGSEPRSGSEQSAGPARGDSSWVDDELRRLEQRQAAKDQDASPGTAAVPPKVDAEWERAAEKKREERAAAIEAEAERIERELDAARQRQAQEGAH